MFGDLTKNFSRSEFRCSCCDFDTVDYQLLDILQSDIRDHYNKRVVVTSGCRCREHNKRTPGASIKSFHVVGKAADIAMPDVVPVAIYTYLAEKFKDRFGIGLYEGWVHFDVGPYRRWRQV